MLSKGFFEGLKNWATGYNLLFRKPTGVVCGGGNFRELGLYRLGGIQEV